MWLYWNDHTFNVANKRQVWERQVQSNTKPDDNDTLLGESWLLGDIVGPNVLNAWQL